MPINSKHEILFDPPLTTFNAQRAGKPLTALAGANNTGKSLALKFLKQQLGRSAYLLGPNRFYHVYHFSSGMRSPNEIDEFENQFLQSFNQEQHNHENNFFDLNRIIIGLSNRRRNELLDLCGSLLGCTLTLRMVDEENDLSLRYVDMDGQNVAVGSTGTRLLLTMLGICMDDRFPTIMIDEPELGLSPKVQQALVTFLVDPVERAKYFPHLAAVYVATHSHLFLNRHDIESDYVVAKQDERVSLTQIRTISDFHRLQFNLLGNSLESMFLPSAIIVVEGKTDAEYIERIVGVRYPDRRISVTSSGGDVKRKVMGLKEAFGDLTRTPLRSRIFVVLDSVHPNGISRDLADLGVPAENIVVWDRNGIEFVYPSALVASVFSCPPERAGEIQVNGDVISLNGIDRKKNDLKADILSRLDGSTVLPEELERKLLDKVRQAID